MRGAHGSSLPLDSEKGEEERKGIKSVGERRDEAAEKMRLEGGKISGACGASQTTHRPCEMAVYSQIFVLQQALEHVGHAEHSPNRIRIGLIS